MFDFNVQHDCIQGKCAATGSRRTMQERTETDQHEACLEHTIVDQYVVNTHAFHNAHHVRTLLPPELTRPVPYAEDRKAHHHQIASGFREIQEEKREGRARKAEERKSKPVKEKQGTEPAQGVPSKRKRADTHLATNIRNTGGGACELDLDDHLMIVDM